MSSSTATGLMIVSLTTTVRKAVRCWRHPQNAGFLFFILLDVADHVFVVFNSKPGAKTSSETDRNYTKGDVKTKALPKLIKNKFCT